MEEEFQFVQNFIGSPIWKSFVNLVGLIREEAAELDWTASKICND